MTQNYIRNDIYRPTPKDSNVNFDSYYQDDGQQVGTLNLKASQWAGGRSEYLDTDTLGIQIPEPKDRKYTSLKQVDDALDLLFLQLNTTTEKPTNGSISNQLSSLTVDSLALYISLIVTDGLNARAKDLMKALDALHDTQKAESAAKLKDQIDAINKNIEQSHKAHKHNIFTAVIDWVVSSAEVVAGAFKIAAGVASGNPLAIASGVAEMLAGVMGLVEASLETAALCEDDPEKAKKLRDVAEKIGYAQMALEGVAALLDVTQTARGMMAASKAAKAASGAATATEMGTKVAATVAAESAGQITKAEAQVIFKQLSKELAREMLENEAQVIFKQLSKELAREMLKNVSKDVAKEVAKSATEEAAKKLIEEAAENAIKEAAEVAAKKMAQEGLEVGSEALTTAIVESIAKSVKQEVSAGIARILKSGLEHLTTVTNAVTTGSQSIFDFVMNRKMAELRREIADLMADQQLANQFLEVLNQLMDKQRSRVKETLKMIADGQNTTQSNIESLSNANGMMAGMMGKA